MVFPVIIILRSRDYLTEKMQENINIFWGVRGLPRWSRICGKSNTFFERKSLLNDNFFKFCIFVPGTARESPFKERISEHIIILF